LPLNGRITARFIVTTALLPVLDIPEVELFPDDIRRDDDTSSTVCTAMKTNMNTARSGTRLPPQVIADFTFGQYMYSANNNMSILGNTLELEQLQYFVDGRGTLQAKKGR